jgi:hypothetical protein
LQFIEDELQLSFRRILLVAENGTFQERGNMAPDASWSLLPHSNNGGEHLTNLYPQMCLSFAVYLTIVELYNGR